MQLKEKLLAKLKPGSFLRSAVTIASGTVIAQIIAVLVSPLITRLFTPEDMGIVASFIAITTILGTIAAGRYELAIVLPETDKESNAVAFAGLIFSFIFSFILTIVAIVFYKPLITVLKLQGMAATWFYLIGFFILLTGFELVLNRTAIRNAHFKVIATTQITQQISGSGIKIAFGFLHPGTIGLFIAHVLSQTARIVRLSMGEFKIIFSKVKRPSIADIKYAFKRYKKFPLVSSWAGFMGTATIQLPVVLFTALFSSEIAGYYSLGHRILTLPMALIGSSVANVFLERAAKSKDDDKELGRITSDIYKKLLLISSLIMSIVTFYGDILFPFVFGGNWLMAGKFAQWLSIWLVFQFAISPLSSIYVIKEKQTENLIWNIIQLAGTIFSIILFMPIFSNSINIVAVFAIANALLYFFYAYRIHRILKIKHLQFLKIIFINCISIFIGQWLFSFLLRLLISKLRGM